MKMFITLLTASLLCLSSVAYAGGDHEEVTQEVRDKAATAKLTKQKRTVAVYAKGLCCASCAIGVRKKVKELAFVDTKRFEDGVKLDPKTQIVTVALKKGKEVDVVALREAISNAGYTPVHLYTLQKGSLQTQAFKKSNK